MFFRESVHDNFISLIIFVAWIEIVGFYAE